MTSLETTDRRPPLRQEWLTSGYRDTSGGLRWAGDNSDVTNSTQFFPDLTTMHLDAKDKKFDLRLNRIVYRYYGE